MRLLLNITFPHERFNEAVRNGTAGKKINAIIEETRPEAVYFTERKGQRGAVMIVNLDDPSKIPALSEPWFLTFNADVEFRIVMSPEDLQRSGLEQLGRMWS